MEIRAEEMDGCLAAPEAEDDWDIYPDPGDVEPFWIEQIVEPVSETHDLIDWLNQEVPAAEDDWDPFELVDASAEMAGESIDLCSEAVDLGDGAEAAADWFDPPPEA